MDSKADEEFGSVVYFAAAAAVTGAGAAAPAGQGATAGLQHRGGGMCRLNLQALHQSGGQQG